MGRTVEGVSITLLLLLYCLRGSVLQLERGGMAGTANFHIFRGEQDLSVSTYRDVGPC